MKKHINTYLLFISILFFNTLNAQLDYNSIVDTSILNTMILKSVEGINTSDLEFSPIFYDNGIVYVSSSSKDKKKFDLNINEAFFTLKYASFDSLDNLNKEENFSYDLKIKNHLGPCAFNENEDILFLSRNKKGKVKKGKEDQLINHFGVYLYKFNNGFWIFDEEFPLNSSNYNIFHPTWDESNSRLIFASDMPGGYGKTDLYSIKLINGNWTELKNLGPNINSEDKEAFPYIYNSKYLFYASDKKGGKGGFDLYFSQEENETFSKSINLGKKFNSDHDDFSLILNSDASKGYLTSSRNGGKGKDDIYSFSSPTPIFSLFNNYFTINVKDAKSLNPIKNAKITFSKYKLIAKEKPKITKIKGIDKEIIYTIDQNSIIESEPIYSNSKGINKTKLPTGSYIVKVIKPGYSPYSSLVNTENSAKLIDVKMKHDVKDKFEFSFLDSENQKLINNMRVQIEGGDENTISKNNGLYTLLLSRGTQLKIIANSDDYVKKEIIIKYLKTPFKFDIVMDKKQRYVDYLPTNKGETMVLKNIYYKYNSDKLTKTAKKELQRLLNHLNQHNNLIIEVSSHTDSRGRKQYNRKLSERRSKSVKAYLISKGIKNSRIKIKGYGETKLINHCADGVKCSENEHAINRRTEVKVLD